MSENPFHIQILRKDLTPKLNNLTPIIVEELGLAMERHMNAHASGSLDGQWAEVNIWQTMMKVIAQVSNRVFVGEEICRNDTYLDLMVRYATLLVPVAKVMKLFPRALYP